MELDTNSESSLIGVSVVIPVVERVDDVEEVYQVHARVLRDLGHRFEFIFVLDGAFERVANTLDALIEKGEPIRVVRLAKSFGEATALAVGFEQSSGEVILTLPAYHQTVPDGIRTILSRLEQGWDLVSARRFPRRDSWLNRVQNYGFHWILRWFTAVTFQDITCGLKAIRKPLLKQIPLYGDLHRFLPLLAHQKGFQVIEVDVPQHPADTVTRLHRPGVYLRRLLDILTVVFLVKFTQKPLRFFGLIGTGVFSIGALITLILGVERLVGNIALGNRPLLILGVLLMVLGVQTASIGLLGEIIIFTHARKWRGYTVEKFLK